MESSAEGAVLAEESSVPSSESREQNGTDAGDTQTEVSEELRLKTSEDMPMLDTQPVEAPQQDVTVAADITSQVVEDALLVVEGSSPVVEEALQVVETSVVVEEPQAAEGVSETEVQEAIEKTESADVQEMVEETVDAVVPEVQEEVVQEEYQVHEAETAVAQMLGSEEVITQNSAQAEAEKETEAQLESVEVEAAGDACVATGDTSVEEGDTCIAEGDTCITEGNTCVVEADTGVVEADTCIAEAEIENTTSVLVIETVETDGAVVENNDNSAIESGDIIVEDEVSTKTEECAEAVKAIKVSGEESVQVNNVVQDQIGHSAVNDGHIEAENAIEFQFVLNDDTLSMNGVQEELKDPTGTIIKIDADTTLSSVVTLAGTEVQNADGTIITLPSETVTEVTFSEMQVLEGEQETIIQGDEQVVILPEDQIILMETEETEETGEEYNQSESDLNQEEERKEMESVDTKPPVNIPCHVLGRSIDKPLVDPVRNGRVLLKPRLGVKIPYRNLTSQIVSKQEIADEIMERSRQRQSAAEPPAGGDVFFAKKLTQRLAKKLVPSASSGKKASRTSSTHSSKKSALKSEVESESKPLKPKPVVKETPPSKIIDNSDLIALLEGDDVPDWNIGNSEAISSPLKPEKMEKPSIEWEKEMALKQLRDLPKHTKHGCKVLSTKTTIQSTLPAVQNSIPKVEEKPIKVESVVKVTKSEKDVDHDKDDLNIEPRFSSSNVVKTYTRKRKPLEDFKPSIAAAQLQPKSEQKSEIKSSTPKQAPPASIDLQKSSTSSSTHKTQSNAQKSSSVVTQKPTVPQKTYKASSSLGSSSVNTSKTPKLIPAEKDKDKDSDKDKKRPGTPLSKVETQKALSPNTYISKSSRIVKRKKIWDPDEATPPSKLIKSPKPAIESVEKISKTKPTIEKVEKAEKVESHLPKLKTPAVTFKPVDASKKIIKKAMVKRRKFKRLSEVDRLLMDEGAVNLLYSVKSADGAQGLVRKKKKRALISLDRAQRDLLNKTNELKNDLQINSTKDSPISLRKKEGVSVKVTPTKDAAAAIMHRKRSKDSLAGSVHSPPASPGYTTFHTQRAEASRIIRRHSSSSFSSDENTDGGEENQKQKKKTREKHPRVSLGAADKALLGDEMAKNFNKPAADDAKYSQFETFKVRKFTGLVQLILVPVASSGHTILSLKMMNEMVEMLRILDKDKSCRTVMVSSSGNAFCQGIDYKELVSDDKATRLSVAEKYAAAVREFLTILTKFSKLLVAGVHGNAVGLGVTMLLLFDMVLASDTATFSAPYAQLGCSAEGTSLMALPHVMHNALASELFFASRKLTAAEGLRLGLVTRTLWPDKFQEELIASLKVIAGQSLQSMQSIKKQLRQHLVAGVDAALKAESPILLQHWTSSECQSNFSSYSMDTK